MKRVFSVQLNYECSYNVEIEAGSYQEAVDKAIEERDGDNFDYCQFTGGMVSDEDTNDDGNCYDINSDWEVEE